MFSHTLLLAWLYPFLCFTAAVRKIDQLEKSNLTEFGRYVAECLPKYVQKVQIACGNELEILIAPEGILPVLYFLKDHHACQFANLSDIAGMDIPSRSFRFEVGFYYLLPKCCHKHYVSFINLNVFHTGYL